jgi:hypothetical protein
MAAEKQEGGQATFDQSKGYQKKELDSPYVRIPITRLVRQAREDSNSHGQTNVVQRRPRDPTSALRLLTPQA